MMQRDQDVEAYARDKKLYKLAKAKADYLRLKREVDQDTFREYGPTPEMEHLPDTIPIPRQLFMQEYRQQELDKWWSNPIAIGDKPPKCTELDKQARKVWSAMSDADRQRYVERVHDLVEQAFKAI
ncbi:hypothetical protein AMAG_03272 [Allomyces macrogynus ATCC 38327]|uniref:Uncharacterized protein n=1 Tax=Allomyces macrogynus (strain ATCC 38327) TaxID=578462 RepID=A0A0L0S550_ALLM3|nr:hypothetical protein AMAG_03272 [Allomyces macrogynus ATCC 38327]|eukprot:KNE57580.1 hypothetical protein AMAG_03272 [Allomyces macrogynus ATCC 38327]